MAEPGTGTPSLPPSTLLPSKAGSLEQELPPPLPQPSFHPGQGAWNRGSLPLPSSHPGQAGGAANCSLPTSGVQVWAHTASVKTQAASRVVVHSGTLPGTQAVPLSGARNIAEAVSYGDGFGSPLPDMPGKELTALYFTSGPYAASILIRGITNYSLSLQNIQRGSFLFPCQHISFNCLGDQARSCSLSPEVISFLCSLMTGPRLRCSPPLPPSLFLSLPPTQAGCFAIKVCNPTIGREIN